MRPALTFLLLLAVTRPALAEIQPFFLHESPTPVPVAGGTSTFFIDAINADPGPRLIEQNTLGRGETAALPTFTSIPFVTDGTLLPIASVRLHFGANQKMRSCATVAANLVTVASNGTTTPNGGAEQTVTIEQGSATVVTDTTRIEFAIANPIVLAGEGFAVSSSLTNDCAIKRRTFFDHGGAVRFQCCFTTAAKCGAKKIAAVNAGAYCRLGVVAKESGKGVVLDPTDALACDLKTTIGFLKGESRGPCLTTGDGPDFVLLSSALVGELDADLDPLGPGRRNKCQALKIKTAGKRLQCLLKLEATAVQKAQLLDPDPAKVAKCDAKFAKDFAKAEAKGSCDTTGDAAAIAAKVDTFVTTVSSRLACPCP